MKGVKSLLLICLGALSISSCLKQGAATPPDTSQLDPNLPVNTTLRDLGNQALSMGNRQYRVLGDTTISGIVVADDRSNSFYKQLIIQDASGGMLIAIDKASLYLDYPIGRKIYVKLKGLVLENYNGLPEITYNPAAAGNPGIPAILVGNYVVKASYPNTVTPIDVTSQDLSDSVSKYYNTLIRLGAIGSDPVEFDDASAGVPYSLTSAGTPRYIKDKNGSFSFDMYNSSFSTFQSALTPTGSGSVTVIFSNYNGIQLLLRDTTDVQLTGPRF